MIVPLNLNRIEDYRRFLKIKSLPRFRFAGTFAEIPDEYASSVGMERDRRAEVTGYTPWPGLFDYQRAIASIAIRKQKFAVFADCGLGKTFILLEFARHALSRLGGKSVLIVSPLMVCGQTIRESERFYRGSLPIEQVRSNRLREWLKSGSGVGITNYEAFSDSLPDRGNLGAMILDESSMLKSHYGKWGQRIIDLGKGLDWKLCSTGTPAPNDQIEYANHAVFLDQFPTVNSFLAKFFINRGETQNRWELKPHALDRFYHCLSHWSFFLSNPAVYGWKDNVSELPPIVTEVVPVELTEDQITKATELTGGLFGGKVGGIGGRAKIARIAKGVDAESLKPETVARLAREAGEPCIVWCKYNPEQDTLAKLLPEAANIDGKTSVEDRERLIGAFQNGSKSILISKPKILGFGLNLQIATTHIFSTLQDSYEEYYQAVKRSNRYGSTHRLRVVIPLTEIELPMYENVLRKADRIRKDTEEQERIFKEVNRGMDVTRW